MKPHHMLSIMRQVSSAAGALKEITDETKRYVFQVSAPPVVYVQVAGAAVRLRRWDQPQVELTVRLVLPVGWRMATEQDEVGVYVVAHRRRMIGGLSGGTFEVVAPHSAHVILNLDDCAVHLGNVSGTLELPPSAPGAPLSSQAGG